MNNIYMNCIWCGSEYKMSDMWKTVDSALYCCPGCYEIVQECITQLKWSENVSHLKYLDA